MLMKRFVLYTTSNQNDPACCWAIHSLILILHERREILSSIDMVTIPRWEQIFFKEILTLKADTSPQRFLLWSFRNQIISFLDRHNQDMLVCGQIIYFKVKWCSTELKFTFIEWNSDMLLEEKMIDQHLV